MAGADAILLIVAALEPEDLRELHPEARALDLDVLVEVHDEEELEIALDVDADVIGINNRDLRDFTVDVERTYELLADVPRARRSCRSRASPPASSSRSSSASASTPCWSARR